MFCIMKRKRLKSRPVKSRYPKPGRPLVELGRRIRQRREELQLGLRDAARLCGVDYTLMFRVEHGHDVRASALLKVAKFYQIPLDPAKEGEKPAS